MMFSSSKLLVDNGLSVNILPLAVLTAAGVPMLNVVGSQISINGFGNNYEEAIGYIQIDLKIGLVRSFTKLFMININVAYHAVLGRPWINKHKLVASTYHQCIKRMISLRPIHIPRNQMPFNLNKVHNSDAKFYNDFLSAGSGISQASKILLSPQEDVRDLNDQKFLATVEKGKRIQPDANVFVYSTLMLHECVSRRLHRLPLMTNWGA